MSSSEPALEQFMMLEAQVLITFERAIDAEAKLDAMEQRLLTAEAKLDAMEQRLLALAPSAMPALARADDDAGRYLPPPATRDDARPWGWAP